MTIALCLNCGQTKHGAICPCIKCGAGPTGNFQLDIAFSDHHIAPKSLQQLGDVIQAINVATDDEALRHHAFIYYISENHPSILTVEMQPEALQACRTLLASVALPELEIKPSKMHGTPGKRGKPPKKIDFSKMSPWTRLACNVGFAAMLGLGLFHFFFGDHPDNFLTDDVSPFLIYLWAAISAWVLVMQWFQREGKGQSPKRGDDDKTAGHPPR